MALTIESAATVGIPSSIGSSGRPRSGIVVHYVGGNAISRGAHSTCRRQVRNWHRYHRNTNGWAGLGYHFTICHHGIVMTGRGLHRVGAHAPGANASHVGVLIMLGGSQQPTASQLAGFREFRAWLGRQGVRQGNVTPHSRWISTSCPGNHLRSRVNNNNWGTGGTPGGGGGGGGSTAGRSIRSQQQTVNALGYTPPLAVDGIHGPKTEAGVRWLQSTVGAAVDGDWGPETERLYLAYLEDDVPDHNRYWTTKGQTVPPNEWRQVEFHASSQKPKASGGLYSVVLPGKRALLYSASANVRFGTDLPEGTEVQIRFAEYEEGKDHWEPDRTRGWNEWRQQAGKLGAATAQNGHCTTDRRLRLQVKHLGDGPATLEWAEVDPFVWEV